MKMSYAAFTNAGLMTNKYQKKN